MTFYSTYFFFYFSKEKTFNQLQFFQHRIRALLCWEDAERCKKKSKIHFQIYKYFLKHELPELTYVYVSRFLYQRENWCLCLFFQFQFFSLFFTRMNNLASSPEGIIEKGTTTTGTSKTNLITTNITVCCCCCCCCCWCQTTFFFVVDLLLNVSFWCLRDLLLFLYFIRFSKVSEVKCLRTKVKMITSEHVWTRLSTLCRSRSGGVKGNSNSEPWNEIQKIP